MNYGFIGVGNLAAAVIQGAIASEKVLPGNIYIYNKNNEKQHIFADKFNVHSCQSLDALLSSADIIFLAVKPHIISEIMLEIKELLLPKKHLLVSLAAVRTLSEISEMAPGIPIMRVMPNLNAGICCGLAAFCTNDLINENYLQEIKLFFEASGTFLELPEKQFPLFAALAGSSPAFVYLFIESLAKAAHKMGMNKQQALDIAAQSVLGSAKLLLNSSEHPYSLIDKVCSPGGMTIEGICTLEQLGFPSAVVAALDATVLKEEKLRKK